MHFTGVVGTSAWAGVYVTQVCFYTNEHICDTLAAGCAHMCICIYVCICMYVHMDAYVRLWYCLTRWGQKSSTEETYIGKRNLQFYIFIFQYRLAMAGRSLATTAASRDSTQVEGQHAKDSVKVHKEPRIQWG